MSTGVDGSAAMPSKIEDNALVGRLRDERVGSRADVSVDWAVLAPL